MEEEALPVGNFSKSREGTKEHIPEGKELRTQCGSHPQESVALEALSMAQPLDTPTSQPSRWPALARMRSGSLGFQEGH